MLYDRRLLLVVLSIALVATISLGPAMPSATKLRVEEGSAPEEIIAYRVTDIKVTRTPLIYANPQLARTSLGIIDEAGNLVCREPRNRGSPGFGTDAGHRTGEGRCHAGLLRKVERQAE